MDSPNIEAISSAGVVDYYSRIKPKRATSRLVALAPDVLVIAYCEGAPEAAMYFEKFLECKVTERMIKTIKANVAKKKILVTCEELKKAALSHPITAARLAREPALCDPQHYFRATAPKPEEKKIDLKVTKTAAVKKAVRSAPKSGNDSLTGKPSIFEKPRNQVEVPTALAQDEPTGASEWNKLLDESDAELRKAGLPID
jgi:hypothetical protein